MCQLHHSLLRHLSGKNQPSTWEDFFKDVAVNELDFMGEYFYRKDMPQTHFAWFQPRFWVEKSSDTFEDEVLRG